jgi:hypothetical protein
MHFLAISSIIRNFQTQRTQLAQDHNQKQERNNKMATSSQQTGKTPSEDPASTGGVFGNLAEGKTPAIKSIEGAYSRAGGANHGTPGQSCCIL